MRLEYISTDQTRAAYGSAYSAQEALGLELTGNLDLAQFQGELRGEPVSV